MANAFLARISVTDGQNIQYFICEFLVIILKIFQEYIYILLKIYLVGSSRILEMCKATFLMIIETFMVFVSRESVSMIL